MSICFHVTVPPTFTVMDIGLNVKSMMSTTACIEADFEPAPADAEVVVLDIFIPAIDVVALLAVWLLVV